MLSNGFLLNIEKLVRILNDRLPDYSNISCDFKSFNEVGINESYIYARYGASKYQIAIWVGDSKYFEEEDSTNKPYKFDIRIESELDNSRYCEHEFEHTQDFKDSINIAINWIEKKLKEILMQSYY